MNKLQPLLFVLLVLVSQSAIAQTYPMDRGSFLVSGTAGFTSHSTSYDDDAGRTTSFAIRPNVQYFAAPGLALGGVLGFSYHKFDDNSHTTYSVGPAVNYYLGGPEKKVYPYVGVQSSFNFSKERTDMSGKLLAGGVLMIAKNVGLTGEAFYNIFRVDFEEEDRDPMNDNAFGVTFGIAAFVF